MFELGRPSNFHGFVLDGQSYRPGWAATQTTSETTVSSARITSLTKCACRLITAVVGGALPSARRSSQATFLSN